VTGSPGFQGAHIRATPPPHTHTHTHTHARTHARTHAHLESQSRGFQVLAAPSLPTALGISGMIGNSIQSPLGFRTGSAGTPTQIAMHLEVGCRPPGATRDALEPAEATGALRRGGHRGRGARPAIALAVPPACRSPGSREKGLESRPLMAETSEQSPSSASGIRHQTCQGCWPWILRALGLLRRDS
jgi:hypothetical protein